MRPTTAGYALGMDISDARRPVDLQGVPAEEDVSQADATGRLDQDPSAVPNRAQVPEDGSADTSRAED
jgi:hypothetical protein